MPAKPAGKGGKRGRPPNASKAQDASSKSQPSKGAELPQDLNDELSFEDQSTPKPGVLPPSKTPKTAAGGSQAHRRRSPEHPDSTPRRAGVASQTPQGGGKDDELADVSIDTPGSANKGRRRKGHVNDGLQSVAEEVAEQPEQGSAEGAKEKRKRGRPAKPQKSGHPEESIAVDESEPTKKRKRGRPSLQSKAAESTPLRETQTQGNKGKRKAAALEQEKTAEDTTEPPAKKPRGRKPRISEPAGPTPERRPRGRPRTSDAAASIPAQDASSSTQKSKSKPSPSSTGPRKGRRRTDEQVVPALNTLSAPQPQQQPEEPAEEDRPRSPIRNYRHIGAKPTSIPVSTIQESWSPLPAPSVSLATSLLRLAERPVLQRISTNAKRRDHAAFVLRKVSQTISRRLTRQFPFPPALGTTARKTQPRESQPQRRNAPDPRDGELDYEHVLSAVKSLQTNLDTLLHSNRLLESERDKEEALLAKEYAELDKLEANARSEARGLREKLRKTHPLVPEAASQRQGAAEGPLDVKFSTDETTSAPLFTDMEAVQLPRLDVQLASHMDSLRTNLGQVEGVVPEIAQSRAALRDVLAQHLAPEQYEHVILG